MWEGSKVVHEGPKERGNAVEGSELEVSQLEGDMRKVWIIKQRDIYSKITPLIKLN